MKHPKRKQLAVEAARTWHTLPFHEYITSPHHRDCEVAPVSIAIVSRRTPVVWVPSGLGRSVACVGQFHDDFSSLHFTDGVGVTVETRVHMETIRGVGFRTLTIARTARNARRWPRDYED